MVADLTANQLRRKSARLVERDGDITFQMLAAKRLEMPEYELAAAARWIRQAMVSHMEAQTAHAGADGLGGGLPSKLASVGMLLAALGFEPAELSTEERQHGVADHDHYDVMRRAFLNGGR